MKRIILRPCMIFSVAIIAAPAWAQPSAATATRAESKVAVVTAPSNTPGQCRFWFCL